jgi:nucleoside-diphosphate-sugar epimerase
MTSTSSLKGKRALVTGGSRGIGAAIVRRLASQGAAVAVNYRSDRAAADALVGELREMHREFSPQQQGSHTVTGLLNGERFDEPDGELGRVRRITEVATRKSATVPSWPAKALQAAPVASHAKTTAAHRRRIEQNGHAWPFVGAPRRVCYLASARYSVTCIHR